MLSTFNPNPPDDGLWLRPQTHPCQRRYQDISGGDIHNDYCDLLNMVQRHTRCSTSYCLRKKKPDSEPTCRFNYPLDKCCKTKLEFEKIHTNGNEQQYRAKMVTRRNDSRLNNHQQLQLQGWRANCDIQIVIDHYVCVEYLTKYAAKDQPRTPLLKTAFNSIVNNTPSNANSHKAIKLLVKEIMLHRKQCIIYSLLNFTVQASL